MKILITGGCKNGKSFYAQQCLRSLGGHGDKVYLATLRPGDAEDAQRIARHRQERQDWGFRTVEQATDISACLPLLHPHTALLLDSTTALLSNEMFPLQSEPFLGASEAIVSALLPLCEYVGHALVVSDYIYDDGRDYDPLTEAYRRGLAQIDRALAKDFDVVCELSMGTPIFHKGGDLVWF